MMAACQCCSPCCASSAAETEGGHCCRPEFLQEIVALYFQDAASKMDKLDQQGNVSTGPLLTQQAKAAVATLQHHFATFMQLLQQ